MTFDLAVENVRTLFEAAERAGVGRIVHFSETSPFRRSRPALPCPPQLPDSSSEMRLQGIALQY